MNVIIQLMKHCALEGALTPGPSPACGESEARGAEPEMS